MAVAIGDGRRGDGRTAKQKTLGFSPRRGIEGRCRRVPSHASTRQYSLPEKRSPSYDTPPHGSTAGDSPGRGISSRHSSSEEEEAGR
jgi:hypothetical protein